MKTICVLVDKDTLGDFEFETFVALPVYKEFQGLFERFAERQNHDMFGTTLLWSLCAKEGYSLGDVVQLLKLVLKLNVNLKARSPKLGKNAFEICKKLSHPVIFETLNLSLMGDNLKQSIMDERDRVQRLRTMAHIFLESHKCLEKGSKGYQMLQNMEETVRDAFEKKASFSEDVLFIVWRWTHQTHNGHPLASDLWKYIEANLKQLLSFPINRLHWKWFETHVLPSAV